MYICVNKRKMKLKKSILNKVKKDTELRLKIALANGTSEQAVIKSAAKNGASLLRLSALEAIAKHTQIGVSDLVEN